MQPADCFRHRRCSTSGGGSSSAARRATLGWVTGQTQTETLNNEKNERGTLMGLIYRVYERPKWFSFEKHKKPSLIRLNASRLSDVAVQKETGNSVRKIEFSTCGIVVTRRLHTNRDNDKQQSSAATCHTASSERRRPEGKNNTGPRF